MVYCTHVHEQYVTEGNVDPLKYMCEMRQDRGGIIQTVVRLTYICITHTPDQPCLAI